MNLCDYFEFVDISPRFQATTEFILRARLLDPNPGHISEKPTSGPCHLPRTEFTLCDSSFNVPLYASVSGTRGVAYIARCGVDSCHFVAKGGL